MYKFFIKQPIVALVFLLALLVACWVLIVNAFIHFGFIASVGVIILGNLTFNFLTKKFKAAKLQLQQEGQL